MTGNPRIGLSYPKTFNNYARGVKVVYNGGYDTIPYDLKLAVLNYVKILWKQEQGTASMSFQGGAKSVQTPSANFPPHVRRILDLYRII